MQLEPALFCGHHITNLLYVVFMAYEDNNVGARDLRLKLQKKSLGQASQRGSLSGVRDLRDKLTGLNDTQPMNVDPPKRKLEAPRPTRKSIAEFPAQPEPKKGTNPAPRKKACIFFFFSLFFFYLFAHCAMQNYLLG